MQVEFAVARNHHELANEIMDLVMRHRRVAQEEAACAHRSCPACVSQHARRMARAIARGETIIFVLPAFPGKSPNPAKVLSARADMAERQSLAFLQTLCRRISEIYLPGAKIVLCSDGRVFNDIVGIEDSDITTYQNDLTTIIRELRADSLSTFNLDNVFDGRNFEEMRSLLMSGFGESLEAIQADVRTRAEAQRMYRGITRFLFEDGLRPNMSISKTALQKQSRIRAYQVIQRSRAWDMLLAELFPEAVRLSIHPQGCGSRKIGIHLMETSDVWLTAWHSVAVEVEGRFRLMKREAVENLEGAELIYREGRPSHFVIARMPEELP